jgi:hypothetical protein
MEDSYLGWVGRAKLQSIIYIAVLTASASLAQAQESGAGLGPIKTPAGMVEFVPQAAGFEAQINSQPFDHLTANRITHFDETSGARMIVESFKAKGPPSLTLYDLRKQPPSVEHIPRPMALDSVFWQTDEVVLKGTQGWFRYQHGLLTKLASSKTIYH